MCQIKCGVLHKETAKDALDTHADKMIGDYQTTINKLLKGFGAGFTSHSVFAT